MTPKENTLRAWRFQKPEWIPIASGLPWLDWVVLGYDPEELERIVLSHTKLFPDYQKGTIYTNHDNLKDLRPDLVKGNKHVDGWGCTWETPMTGMFGAVSEHALDSWDKLPEFKAPNIEKSDGYYPLDWDKLKNQAAQAHEKDDLYGLHLPHGHTFLRIQDIRGYQNLMFDMYDEKPELVEVLGMIEKFNLELINRYIELAPDVIAIPEDLGMQTTPMITPEMFKKYIKPIYLSMTKLIKEKGIIVHEHSDGFIIPLIDDLIECGGDVLNLQDLVNGIDEIEKHVKGRIAIDLDIDRQNTTVNGSTKDIDDMIHEEVSKLASKEGGLSLTYQPWPPTPAKNMDAVFTAMEKYCTFWS